MDHLDEEEIQWESRGTAAATTTPKTIALENT